MTVQTREPTTVAAPSCHGQGSAAGDGYGAHESHATANRESGTGATALGAIVALPRTVKIIGSAAVGFGALLAVGVPLATLTPLLAVGGCLSMHLFMGHGGHGGGHGPHDSSGGAPASGSAEDTSTRTGA